MAKNKKTTPPRNSLQRRNTRLALGLLSPALVILAILTLVPMIYTLVISLFRYNLQRGPTPQAFIGLENYLNAFTDARFWDRVLTTAVYTVISVSLTVVLGLLIALLLQKPSRTHTWLKVLLIFPYCVSSVVKGYLWKFMLNSGGLLDQVLDFFLPFAADFNWLSNRWSATFFLASTEIWGWAPLIALMFLGSLGSISPSIFEAAELDGANNRQLFWKVTLPLMKPIIATTTVMKTIFSLKMFDTIIPLTGGGPGDATQTLNYYIYNQAFKYSNMGYGAALSIVVIVIVAIVVGFYIKMTRKEKA